MSHPILDRIASSVSPRLPHRSRLDERLDRGACNKVARRPHLTGMITTIDRLTRFASRRFLLAAVLTLAVIGGAGATGAAAAASSTPFCGITWGSLPRAAGDLSTPPLLDVRTGQHDCYDRVVFDFGRPLFGGPASGYRVAYSDTVTGQGQGAPLRIAGGAKLAVLLLEPADDPRMPDVAGYRTLRDIVYGGSFEGYTTIGIGVRARLPFRVLTLAGPGDHSRIVIDVAHRWSA
jgi:hypothetical protein